MGITPCTTSGSTGHWTKPYQPGGVRAADDQRARVLVPPGLQPGHRQGHGALRRAGHRGADRPDRAARGLKPDVRGRRQLVDPQAAGFLAPDPFTGEVIAAMARPGCSGCAPPSSGTVAYQAYPALLGVRLPATAMRTEDVDFAQFHGIAVGIGEAAEPLLGDAQEVDASFAPVPSLNSPMLSSSLRNARGYRVELLDAAPGGGGARRRPGAPALAAGPGRAAAALPRLPALRRGADRGPARARDRGQRAGPRALRRAQADRRHAPRPGPAGSRRPRTWPRLAA